MTHLENKQKLFKVIKTFTNFLDNINISLQDFRRNKYDIVSTLNESKNDFYFDELRITNDNEKEFVIIFEKWCNMISSILELYNHIPSIHLDNFIEIANTDKFDIFSPVNLLDKYILLFNNDKNSQNIQEFSKKYYNDYKIVKKNYKLFDRKYKSLIGQFVLCSPENYDLLTDYFTNFSNSLFETILEFCKNMINMNVYAIPRLINDVISEYINIYESFYLSDVVTL